MKLLKEKFFQKQNYCFCRYDGYFEHTRGNGEVMLLHIIMNTQYNSEDIDVDLFTKDNGFKTIANFWTIEGLTPIEQFHKGDRFVELVGINLNAIEEWLDIVFY
jgi:hypothetical protein